MGADSMYEMGTSSKIESWMTRGILSTPALSSTVLAAGKSALDRFVHPALTRICLKTQEARSERSSDPRRQPIRQIATWTTRGHCYAMLASVMDILAKLVQRSI